MTAHPPDTGRRPRHPLFPSMSLAIELWLRTDHLVESEDAVEAGRPRDPART